MSLILETMVRRGTPLRRQGKWAVGPCPKCGGTDRFRVVENDGKEFFTCRRCNAHGDAIQFLRDFEGMSFAQAKTTVETCGLRGGGERAAPSRIIDEDAWFAANLDIIRRAESYLARSERAQRALMRNRGIGLETAKHFSVGYLPKPLALDREEFGLPPRTRDDGAPRPVYLPPGFTIPILSPDGDLHGLQVRRDEPYQGQRYFTVPGSELIPMVYRGEPGEAVVIVESYLCGMLVFQETTGRYGVVALGTASGGANEDVESAIARAGTVLVALDTDDAGRRQAWRRWVNRYPNAARCPIPAAYGKDPTEAHLNGVCLADWVVAGIALAHDDALTAAAPVARVAATSAAVVHVRTEADAVAAVDSIHAACPAVGVTVNVVSRKGHVEHPQAGWHPRLSRVREVAVYAKAMDKVFVFEMGAVKKRHLLPLWAEGKTVVCHDGVELLRHFAGLRRRMPKLECTLLMANALTNERTGLDVALERFAGATPTVESGGATGTARHAVALSVLLDALRPRLKGGAWKTYLRMRDAQRAVAAMEAAGFSFDAEAHAALVSDWGEAMRACETQLPPDLDPDDDAAVRSWLQAHLPEDAVHQLSRTSNGAISLADENLARFGTPEVDALREHRRLAGLLSRHSGLDEYAAPDTGRIHAAYLLGGASTGRLANRNPCLQNLPRDPTVRRLFRAGEGHKLVVADVSQSQLRIAAAVSGDETMLAAYAEGADLHLRTAAEVLGVPVERVTAEERRRAKAVNFGFLFGQGVPGFRAYAERQYGAHFTQAEAAAVRRAFFETYAGLDRWQEDTIYKVRQTGACTTPGGRVRRFDDGENGNLANQALAFVVQGAEAEIMLEALAGLHAGLAEHGARLVHFVHDEVVVEVPDDEDAVEAVTGLAERAIANAFRRMFPQASVEGLVEAHVASDWASTK